MISSQKRPLQTGPAQETAVLPGFRGKDERRGRRAEPYPVGAGHLPLFLSAPWGRTLSRRKRRRLWTIGRGPAIRLHPKAAVSRRCFPVPHRLKGHNVVSLYPRGGKSVKFRPTAAKNLSKKFTFPPKKSIIGEPLSKRGSQSQVPDLKTYYERRQCALVRPLPEGTIS